MSRDPWECQTDWTADTGFDGGRWTDDWSSDESHLERTAPIPPVDDVDDPAPTPLDRFGWGAPTGPPRRTELRPPLSGRVVAAAALALALFGAMGIAALATSNSAPDVIAEPGRRGQQSEIPSETENPRTSAPLEAPSPGGTLNPGPGYSLFPPPASPEGVAPSRPAPTSTPAEDLTPSPSRSRAAQAPSATNGDDDITSVLPSSEPDEPTSTTDSSTPTRTGIRVVPVPPSSTSRRRAPAAPRAATTTTTAPPATTTTAPPATTTTAPPATTTTAPPAATTTAPDGSPRVIGPIVIPTGPDGAIPSGPVTVTTTPNSSADDRARIATQDPTSPSTAPTGSSTPFTTPGGGAQQGPDEASTGPTTSGVLPPDSEGPGAGNAGPAALVQLPGLAASGLPACPAFPPSPGLVGLPAPPAAPQLVCGSGAPDPTPLGIGPSANSALRQRGRRSTPTRSEVS